MKFVALAKNLTIVIDRGDTGIEKVHNNRNFIFDDCKWRAASDITAIK